jgi:hypothetical protein
MKIVRIRFEDGRTEIIPEDTITLARAFETLAANPATAADIKMFSQQLVHAAARLRAAINAAQT